MLVNCEFHLFLQNESNLILSDMPELRKSNSSPKIFTNIAACECSLPRTPAFSGPPGSSYQVMLTNNHAEYPTITAISS